MRVRVFFALVFTFLHVAGALYIVYAAFFQSGSNFRAMDFYYNGALVALLGIIAYGLWVSPTSRDSIMSDLLWWFYRWFC